MKKLLTTAEALAEIKAAPPGSRFWLRIMADSPIEGEPSKVYPCGLVTALGVSRAKAALVLKRILSPVIESRGGRIPLEIDKSSYSDNLNYWIL